MENNRQFIKKLWLYLIILVIGVSLKFYKIDSRYFWYDEICTVMHTSGIKEIDYVKMFPENEIKNISFYTDLIHLNKQNLSISSQFKGLSQMVNLNPLHYNLLIFWHRIVGDNDIHYRLFNIFMLLLTLPFLFQLSKLLFKTNLAGWIAISIFSVSPFFQYYTQEARYNILCTFLIIINQYLFLQSMKKNKLKWWIGYTLTGILALYSSFILGLMFIANFIYCIIFERKLFFSYIFSSIIILLSYLPWLISVYQNRAEIIAALAWHSWYGGQNIFSLIIAQLYFVAYSFVTLNNFSSQTKMFTDNHFSGNYIHLCANILVMAFIIYAIVYAIKKADKKTLWFMTLTILPQFLFFLISDLVRETGISLFQRYNIFNIIGITLFIVYLLNDKIASGKTIFSGIYLSIISIGIISIIVMPGNKLADPLLNEIDDAALLSGYKKPLLISDLKNGFWGGSAGGVLAIFNECKSDKIDVFRVSANIKNIKEYFNPVDYSEIIVMGASDELVENLKSQFGEEMVSFQTSGGLQKWKINLKPK